MRLRLTSLVQLGVKRLLVNGLAHEPQPGSSFVQTRLQDLARHKIAISCLFTNNIFIALRFFLSAVKNNNGILIMNKIAMSPEFLT